MEYLNSVELPGFPPHNLQLKVQQLLKGLILSPNELERVSAAFKNEMELALNTQPSSLQMENTYIPELPDGTEEGTYLAMDLGGTNLRVLMLHLEEGEVTDETVQYFHIPDSLRVGCGDSLFDFLASCIDSFARKHNLKDDVVYPLGFTFSFPMQQKGLDSGVLVTWTKSFNCPSIVGKDAVEKLRDCLKKFNRKNIEVVAILNDTTGTLIQGAIMDRKTRIGIVLGTGSNACYMEYADRVKHWEQERHGEQHVIIDIEWGAFGDNNVLDFIRTDFDRTLDENSLLKNSFTFEKYISGKYLGELCRIILLKLFEEKLFLSNLECNRFPAAWTFGTEIVSTVEQGALNDSWQSTQHVITHIFQCGTNDYSLDDLKIIRFVCGLISLRAAQLVAINTSVLLNRMDRERDSLHEITIAIDGSVYKHSPRLKYWISDLTAAWAPTISCNFMLAEDGSGKGAALVAAIANKLRKRTKKN